MPIQFTCLQCGAPETCFPSQERRYCSRGCYFSTRPALIERRCLYCDAALVFKPADIRKGGGKFCSHACRYAHQATPAAISARFWAKVDKRPGADDCWIWTGALYRQQGGRGGYGKFKLGNQIMSASRASWIIHNGPVPNGLFVCHNCPTGDERRCVRPSHLFLGTPKANSEDMVKKGRSAVGDRNGSRTHPEAYSKSQASLTLADSDTPDWSESATDRRSH